MMEQLNRPTWGKQIEFTLVGIGCAVGPGNIWRFPYLCYRSGGGAFLVPYLLMLVVLGIPLLHMELMVGQYTRRGPLHAFGIICPLFKGLGITSTVICFISCIPYNLFNTWALYHLFSSFQALLLWQHCNNTWNTPDCTTLATNSTATRSSSPRYEGYVFPPWAQGIGRVITMASIIWIPLAAFHTVWMLPGSFLQRLEPSVTPITNNEISKLQLEENGRSCGAPVTSSFSSNSSHEHVTLL